MLGKKLSKISQTSIIVILGIAIGFLGETMPDEVKTDLTKRVEGFIPLTFTQFWLICVGIVTLLLILYTYLSGKEKPNETANFGDSEREGIIKSLIESYERRLTQKLDQRIKLNLILKYTREGTSEFYTENYFAEDAKDEKEIRSKLSVILNKHHSLLLIGKPGAGKTTHLLELAVEFLEQAKEDKELPYPVILDLSSWQLEKDFIEWCQDILVNGYGFNSKLANSIIKDRKLLPFLDGLDEISDVKLRKDCLEKLQQFRNIYEPEKLVITSRIDEYTDTTADAPVRAEVLIEDLTDAQIGKVLQNAAKRPKTDDERKWTNPLAAQNMLLLRKQNSAFKRVIRTPVYFNLSTQIFDTPFQNTPVQNTELPLEEENLQHYLVETFIEKQMSYVSPKFPSSDKNKHYLSWLAGKLNKDNDKKMFELSTFQPIHLRNPKLFNSFFGLTNGLVVGLGSSLVVDLVFGLIFSPLLCLVTVLFGTPEEIKTEDLRQWKSPNLLSIDTWISFITIFIANFVTGFIFSLVGFFGVYFIFSLVIFSGGTLNWVYGLVLGFVGGLVIGLFSGLVEITSKISLFSKTQKPYQRLKSGLFFNMLKWGFILSILFFIFPFYDNSNESVIISEFFHGLFLGSIIGLIHSNIFLHFVLRFCFYLEGSMPLRYVDFLKYATGIRILEQDGGQWRFRHKILQDYFADLELEKSL